MKPLDQLTAEGLRWVQIEPLGIRFNWELHTWGGEKVASMRQKSIWSYEFEVDSIGNRWEFEVKGFLGLRTEIRSVGTGELAATYFSVSGKIEMVDGPIYFWKPTSLWHMNHGWVDEEDEPQIAFENKGFLKWKYEADVLMKVAPAAAKSLPLLIFFGWYLMVLNYISD